MNVYKGFVLFGFLSTLLYSCALPPEDVEEGGGEEDPITFELPWQGETDKFTINSKVGLRLDDPQEDAGTAYVTIPSFTVKNTRWEFGVRLSFNPSANNYARFYLSSSSDVLSGNLYGYYIQIGGAKDNIALYRQDGNQPKLLASGRELMKGNNSPKLYVKVECDDNGYWTFWTRLESESEYVKEKQVKDDKIQTSHYCGVYCVYTKTRSKGFTFHHIQLSNDVATVSNPGEVPDDDPVGLVLSDYPEVVENILLFNEVMYDNAADGAEYIELYNPSDSTVSIPALKLIRYVDTGSGATETKTTVVLQQPDGDQSISVPSYGYICLTKSAATLINKHKVGGETIIEVPNFPRLTNEDSHLAIATDEEKSRVIDKCSYFEAMHSSGNKRHQGVSLEKASPESASAIHANWYSSMNSTGGTPGRENSRE